MYTFRGGKGAELGVYTRLASLDLQWSLATLYFTADTPRPASFSSECCNEGDTGPQTEHSRNQFNLNC